jgi:hypothetical protein
VQSNGQKKERKNRETTIHKKPRKTGLSNMILTIIKTGVRSNPLE